MTYYLPIDSRLIGQVYTPPEFPGLRITYRSAGDQQVGLSFNGAEILLDSLQDRTHLADDRYLIKVLRQQNNGLVFSIEDQLQTHPLGQQFDVSLEENPSTGYSWQTTLTPGLRIIQDRFTNECPEGIQGCPGTRIWTLVGTSRGDQVFRAEYRRSWEPDPVDVKILKFRIV